MKHHYNLNCSTLKNIGLAFLAAATTLVSVTAQAAGPAGDTDWLANTISPVVNPIYFEDPRIDSEIRPVFMEHRLPGTYSFDGGKAPLGGDVKIFAVQARIALTDRLALIATKDGYIESQPDKTLPHTHGWGDISAGLKYALIDDKQDQFILTPGFTFELPTGTESVFQGKSSGLWNAFVSAGKGFNDVHLTANAGALIPDDFSRQVAELHYSAQLDYAACRYFIPFISANAYTVLTDANNQLLPGVNLSKELNDLSDFGATRAAGTTQFIPGIGFRSRLLKNLDAGFAYEYGLSHPQGVFKDRFTVDLIWRF